MSTEEPIVVNNEAASRFEIILPEGTAMLVYRRSPGVIDYLHTEVPKALEGRQLGSTLARTALEWARDQHLRVIATCPFVRAYIKRHPEYAPLTES